jgi:hypothetical protein
MKYPESIQRTARIAGIMFLIMALIGPFSMMYVPSQLIVSGNASLTASNIMASMGLFRLGIIGHIIILLADLGVALLLYVILKPVNRTAALFAAAFRLIMVGIRGTNLINYFIVLQLLRGGSPMAAFDPGTLHALVMLFLDAFNYGLDLDMVFFSFHLLFLGYLVFYSGFFPRILGVLLFIAFFGYLTIALSSLFFPAWEKVITGIFTIPNALSELALMLWLLIKGVNVEKWMKCAVEAT